jgi:GTP cyclohydrolase II
MSKVRGALTFIKALFRWSGVQCVASAKLPTDYGDFDIHVFESRFSAKTNVALVFGAIGSGENVLTRAHSACLTGDLFNSSRLSLV